MSADARERKTFFFYFAHARSHSLFVFFCLNARQKFHHHSLELVSMVQLSQCQQKWFILFHVFCLFHFFLSSVGSVCLAGLLSQQARQKRTRVLFFFKTRASMRRCWHRDSLRSDIWCSFFCFFPYFSVFCTFVCYFLGKLSVIGPALFYLF